MTLPIFETPPAVPPIAGGAGVPATTEQADARGVERTVATSVGTPALTVIAHGSPVGQGAIRHLGKGRPAVHQNAKTLLPWRDTIRHAAINAISNGLGGYDRTFPLDTPLRCDVTFTVPKPTGAPKRRRVWPSKRPDLDHMVRAALDAITHTAITDDARIVELHAAKRYPLEGKDALNFPGIVLRLYTLDAGTE